LWPFHGAIPTSIRQYSLAKLLTDHLLPYIEHPEAQDRVIRYDDDWVLIRDLYPKSVVHLLLLCRDPAKYVQHPHAAVSDPAFLSKLRAEAEECLKLAASELSRIISPYSAACKARRQAMASESPPDDLPPGRDFIKDFRVGFHAHPSMNHLHLHIISNDSFSESMKHRKNYTVFHSDAFLQLDQLPLPEDDIRRDVEYQNDQYKVDFVCWRCGKDFGNKFKLLKDHLEEEFMDWRKQ
jgi:aprataxin